MRIPPRAGAATAIVFWGISFVATKAALRELQPVSLIFLRFAIGSLLLLAVVRRLPPRDAWPSLAVMGFFGVFVHQLVQAYALTMTSAVNAGWLIGLTPIWSAVLSAAMYGERFGALKVAGLLGGFAGALLVMTRGSISAETLSLPSTRGDVLIFLSTFNWALYSVIGHRTIRRLGPRVATSGAMLAGTAMLVPLFVIGRGWEGLAHLSGRGWGALLFLAIGCSALGYLFWYGALEQLPVAEVASLLYLEPLVTLVAAAILIGERLTPAVAAGGLLVLVSVWMTQAGPAGRGNGDLKVEN